ncbi:lipopolysaccharide biosynthesis protein [Arcobacter ellisii]|nr:oligosaccharide flippase family protein [Arcobacter ellisii]
MNISKEFLIVVIGQIVVLIGGFIFIKLLSIHLSVSEYGIYSLLISASTFFLLLPFSSFDQAVARDLNNHKNNLSRYYSNSICLYIIISIIQMIIILILFEIIKIDLFKEIYKLKWELLVFTFFTIIRNLLLTIENFRRNRNIVTMSKLYENIFKILTVILLYKYFNIDIKNILISINCFLGINILYILFINNSILKTNLIRFKNLYILNKKFIFFSTPLLIWTVFSWTTLNAPVWLIKNFYDLEWVGYFNMLNNIATIFPTQLIGILSAYFSPIYYQKELINNEYIIKSTNKNIKNLFILFTIGGFILFMFHDKIIILLTSEKYLEHSWLIVYLFIISAITNIGAFLSIEIFVYKKMKKLILPNIFTALITVFCGYYALNIFAINGLIFTMFLSSLVYTITVYVNVKKLRKGYECQN